MNRQQTPRWWAQSDARVQHPIRRHDLAAKLAAVCLRRVALWQRELSGERPVPVRSDQIGVQVNLHQQLPAPPAPWWTKPWGLLAVAVVGGVAAAVIAQWLNIQLGLVR